MGIAFSPRLSLLTIAIVLCACLYPSADAAADDPAAAQVQLDSVPNLVFQADIYGSTTPENIEYVGDLRFYGWGGFGTNAHVFRAFLQGGDQIAYAVSANDPNAFSLNVSPANGGASVVLTVTKSEYSTGTVSASAPNQLSYIWEIQKSGFHLRLHKLATLNARADITAGYVVSEAFSVENLGQGFNLNSFSEFLHMDDISRVRDYNNDGVNETLLAINNYSTSGYPVFGKVYLTHQNATVAFVNDGRYAAITHYPAQKSFAPGTNQEVVQAAYVTGLTKSSQSETQVAADARILLDSVPTTIYTIGGYVRDTNGNAIEKATIAAGPTASTLSDTNGRYSIALTEGLAFGTYSLSASKTGYSFTGPISVTIPPARDNQDFTGTAGATDTVAPTGQIQRPSPGETITTTGVEYSATAQDNVGGSGVSRVEFYTKYNGKWHLVGQDTSEPHSVFWKPPDELLTQSLVFSIFVYDSAGNVTRDAGGQRTASFLATQYEAWIVNRAYLNQLALGDSGWEMCSMASIAMVLASARIIESDFESLAAAANAAYASGLRAPGLAQVAAYLNKPGIGMSAEVIDDDDLDVQWRTIRQEIGAGRPVILNAPPSERGGKLTGSGHYIVVVGYAGTPDPNQRRIIAYDPYGQWLGVINTYDRNSKGHDVPAALKGRWVYYDLDALGTVHTITAKKTATGPVAALNGSSMPDEVFILDSRDVVTYLGHGQQAEPVRIYLPAAYKNAP